MKKKVNRTHDVFAERFEERKEFLSDLAYDSAMKSPHKKFGKVKVFFLSSGWHTDWLKNEGDVYVPKDVNDFKKALDGNKVKTIFMGDEIYVPQEALQFFCSQASEKKLVFIEGEIDV